MNNAVEDWHSKFQKLMVVITFSLDIYLLQDKHKNSNRTKSQGYFGKAKFSYCLTNNGPNISMNVLDRIKCPQGLSVHKNL